MPELPPRLTRREGHLNVGICIAQVCREIATKTAILFEERTMGHASILLAEDERSLQFSMSLWLKAMGYEVALASNGIEALTKLLEMQAAAGSFDLMICDIQMPDMSGDTLIETIRSKGIDIPILAVSGYGSKSLLLRLIRLGCDDFIDKPFTPQVLEERIQKALRSAEQKKKKNEDIVLFQRHAERTQQIIHDVNNLLGIAVGYTDMALEELSGPDEVLSKLTTAMSSSRRAAELCDNFLSLVSRMSEEKVRTNLNIVLHRVVSLFNEILPSNIAMQSVIPTSHLWIDGDAERIHQALLNLGLNALDAMPNGGTLRIELSCEDANGGISSETTYKPSGLGTCRIVVSDTGEGISPALLDRIFEKGFTTKFQGNGLGLHVVLQIALEHGGTIIADNAQGGGARFQFLLPLASLQSPVSTITEMNSPMSESPLKS